MIPIPVGDDNPTSRTPVVTYGLVTANVGIFLWTWLGASQGEARALFEEWGYSVSRPLSVQLFSSMFLHAGFQHLFGNMLMLWILGDNVEDKLGAVRYLALYLVGGMVATWTFTLFAAAAPGPHTQMPLVGASGAIAAVMGMYLVFFPEARIRLFWWFFLFIQMIRMRAKWVIGIWFLIDVLRTLAAQGGAFDGIATTAHLGGGAFGIAVALLLKRHLGGGTAGSAWDVHTGFSTHAHPGGHARVVDATSSPGWLAAPAPSEPDLMELEDRITTLVEEDRVRDAIDLYTHYEAHARERPLPGEVQIEIAHEFYEQGLDRDALAAYARYLETEPKGALRGEAKFRTGILLSRRLGRPEDAQRWLREAAREHPDPEIRRFAADEAARIA